LIINSWKNPYRTYWKVRKYFKAPKIKLYIGKWVMGIPIFEQKSWISLWCRDVIWKDKYDSPRYEFAPQINLIFFKWQIFISLHAPSKGSLDESLVNDDEYWEQILWTAYYTKSKTLKEAKETYPWTDYDTNQSSWVDKWDKL